MPTRSNSLILTEEAEHQEHPVSSEPPSPEQAQLRQIVAQVAAQRFSGPLPPPDVLARYNDAVPNGAERIMQMAEKQTDHRMDLEKQVVSADIRRSNAGLVAGLIVALAFLVVSYLLIDDGHDEAGTILGTVDIGSLVGVFIYGTISQRRERQKQRQEMLGENNSS